MNLSVQELALLISALGLGAVLNSVVKAISEKRKVGADSVSVLTAAALTLVKPLQDELERERIERATELERERSDRAREHEQHIRELRDERAQATQLKNDLDAALDECRTLRRGLAAAHDELTRLRARLDEQ